jgi:hypothetical protein
MISLTFFSSNDNKIKRSVLERNLSARSGMSARSATVPEPRVLGELFIMNVLQFYQRHAFARRCSRNFNAAIPLSKNIAMFALCRDDLPSNYRDRARFRGISANE